MNWLLELLQKLFGKKPAQPKAEGVFGTGCAPQPFDNRDYPAVLGAGPFSWSAGYDVEDDLTQAWNKSFKLSPEDQNGSSSCVGQASSMYFSVVNYLETGKWVKFSARDIYSFIFLGGGGGAYMRDGMKRGCDFGILPEAIVSSYFNGNPPSESFMEQQAPVDDVFAALRQLAKGKEYVAVPGDIDAYAKAISINKGLLIGVNGDNNGTWFSEFPKPPASRVWGHALYAGKAKLINGKKYIGVLNSWGKSVGKDGWQWLGEEWFKPLTNVYDGWSLSDRKNKFDREADYEKMKVFIDSPEYKSTCPQPDHSEYHSENWAYVQSKTGLTDITVGMYYDYFQAKKLREQYGI